MSSVSKTASVFRRGAGRDENGNWHIRVAVRDGSGKVVDRGFSMAALAIDASPLWQFLGGAGHVFSAKEKAQLLKQLCVTPRHDDFLVATRVGWCEDVFVTPYRVYGTSSDEILVEITDPIDAEKWLPRGKLLVWRKQIAEICAGNPFPKFSVILGFVSPLLTIVRLPSIGVSWVGNSSHGKSTVMSLGGSVWGGNPDRKLGYCETLRKTANSYDNVARRYRHALLCLDETKLAPAKVLGDMVQLLAGGDTKETAVGTRLPESIALVYQMTSNQPLEEILRQAGEFFDESYTVRLIEILVTEGMFHRLPAGTTAHEFAERIANLVAIEYGTPIDRYLRELTADRQHDPQDLTRWLRERMSWMERRLGIDGNTPGEARRGQYFCLAYAAACLATEYGVLPWSSKESADAVEFAYKAHRAHVTGDRRAFDPISKVERYFNSHRRHFVDTTRQLQSFTDAELENVPGFKIQGRGGDEYIAVPPARFQRQFGDSSDGMLQALKAAQFLRHDPNKLTTKMPIRANRDRDRVYCIRASLLGRQQTLAG